MKPLFYRLFNVRITLLCMCLALLFFSCEKEQSAVRELEFIQEAYYISEGDNIQVAVASGNKKYSLSGFDEDIIAPMVSAADFPWGAIYINALKKGHTDITVKDDISGQEVKLTIHVVDPFVAMEAGDLFPRIENEDFEIYQAVRNTIAAAPLNFFDLEAREILILQQNAGSQFWTFKNAEDAARGTVHKSGKFNVTFSYGGPNRLRLEYEDSEEPVEYALFAPDQDVFSSLLRFSQDGWASTHAANDRSDVKTYMSLGPVSAEIPQNTSVTENYELFLIKDFTSFFKEAHPSVEKVELFQSMRSLGHRRHLKIADGILN